MSILSKQDIDAFQNDGAVALRGVFSKEWIEKLARGLDKNMEDPGEHRRNYTKDGDPGHFFGDYCNWQRIGEYEDFVRNSPAAAIARELMGSETSVFFHEHVVVKEPGTLDPTPWHHDQPYYCVDGDLNCSLWVPLDSVPKETGVEFVKGSHKWGRWFTPQMFIGQSYDNEEGFEPIPDIDAERDQHDFASFDLEPGDCAAFHFRTVHGAPGNTSQSNRRRALAFRWLGDDARFSRRKGVNSPPFPEVTLSKGDKMVSEWFPEIK